MCSCTAVMFPPAMIIPSALRLLVMTLGRNRFMMSGVTLRQPSLNEAYHPALVSISGQSKISLVLPHLTADSLKVCCCLPLKQRECKSSQHICHAEALTSISLGSATWLQSISAGPFQHDKMSTKWGKDKDKKKRRKKRGQVIYERGVKG